MTRILTTPTSKKLLKVTIISMAKRVRAEQKKSFFPKFVPLSQNESDLDIPMLTPT